MNGTNYEVLHFGGFSAPLFVPKYSCFQMLLTCIPPCFTAFFHASRPYSTAENIVVLHILIFKCSQGLFPVDLLVKTLLPTFILAT